MSTGLLRTLADTPLPRRDLAKLSWGRPRGCLVCVDPPAFQIWMGSDCKTMLCEYVHKRLSGVPSNLPAGSLVTQDLASARAQCYLMRCSVRDLLNRSSSFEKCLKRIMPKPYLAARFKPSYGGATPFKINQTCPLFLILATHCRSVKAR